MMSFGEVTVNSIRGRAWRRSVFGVVFGLLVVGFGAVPALAAVAPFGATFKETTTFRACPAGAPPNAICFTGSGTAVGPVIPPGDPNAREYFAGIVDVHTFDPLTHCPVDRNVVTIVTNQGALFLTTKGSACPGTDRGTWQAHGGTGIFARATGSGDVITTTTGQNPNGTIASVSTYTGTLTLPSPEPQD